MAELILRPVSDSSLAHSCSSGSSGYALINEATADDDSTYIYGAVDTTTLTVRLSSFLLSPVQNITGRFVVNSWTIHVRCKGTYSDTPAIYNTTPTLILNENTIGLSNKDLPNNYTDFSWTYKVSSNSEYADISALGTIGMSLETRGQKAKAKNDSFQLRITQAYVVLDYTPVSDTSGTGIYIKQNGAYTQAQAAYKKVNGVWVQQTDTAALKTEIQSGRYKYGG